MQMGVAPTASPTPSASGRRNRRRGAAVVRFPRRRAHASIRARTMFIAVNRLLRPAMRCRDRIAHQPAATNLPARSSSPQAPALHSQRIVRSLGVRVAAVGSCHREAGANSQPMRERPGNAQAMAGSTGQRLTAGSPVVAAASAADWAVSRVGREHGRGWTRWLLEQFEFPYERVRPRRAWQSACKVRRHLLPDAPPTRC